MNYKIKFEEQKDSLLNRINIHKKYGQRDMIAWIMNFFPKKKKLEILDLACGDGKQTSLISKYLKL